MTNYQINYSDWSIEGGYCQVYPIFDKPNLVFKEFSNKKLAYQSYKYHKLLDRFDLAPKIHSKVCRLKFADYGDIKFDDPSGWGYVMEKATTYDPNTKISMKQIQELVEEISQKTGLKFWDCHWYNVGLVKRGRKNKVVCIDTGSESFDGCSNAWGLADPGPKCGYCKRYECKCETN